MVRVLAVILWIAVTVYALTDWYRTPDEELPARIPKPVWLLVMLITVPSFSIGSVAWIILRAVGRAEAGQSPLPFTPPSPHPASEQSSPTAPDDNPDFLFRLERDIQRERRRRQAEEDVAAKGGVEPENTVPETGEPENGQIERSDPEEDRGDDTGGEAPSKR